MTKSSRHEKRKARFARKARCAGCGKDIQPADNRACDARGKYRCYPCAAEEEKRAMLRGGLHCYTDDCEDCFGK